MSDKVFNYELQILERHLDTFGHVNNATYLQLFEEARWDFITKNGFGMKEIQETGIGPVILEAHIQFRKEIHNREQIRIETRPLKREVALRMEVEQILFNEKGQVATRANFVFVSFDLKSRKMVTPPEAFLKAWGYE